jgi:hypothetical protein
MTRMLLVTKRRKAIHEIHGNTLPSDSIGVGEGLDSMCGLALLADRLDRRQQTIKR